MWLIGITSSTETKETNKRSHSSECACVRWMQQETEREGECAGFIERDSVRARMRENVYVCSCEREIEINCERKRARKECM